MAKTSSLTVRIAEPLKRRIEARAAREHRSGSAQVEHELSQALAEERAPGSWSKRFGEARFACL